MLLSKFRQQSHKSIALYLPATKTSIRLELAMEAKNRTDQSIPEPIRSRDDGCKQRLCSKNKRNNPNFKIKAEFDFFMKWEQVPIRTPGVKGVDAEHERAFGCSMNIFLRIRGLASDERFRGGFPFSCRKMLGIRQRHCIGQSDGVGTELCARMWRKSYRQRREMYLRIGSSACGPGLGEV